MVRPAVSQFCKRGEDRPSVTFPEADLGTATIAQPQVGSQSCIWTSDLPRSGARRERPTAKAVSRRSRVCDHRVYQVCSSFRVDGLFATPSPQFRRSPVCVSRIVNHAGRSVDPGLACGTRRSCVPQRVLLRRRCWTTRMTVYGVAARRRTTRSVRPGERNASMEVRPSPIVSTTRYTDWPMAVESARWW